jgi:radical SAM protein with 4Fe4S-binding SPASM domain
MSSTITRYYKESNYCAIFDQKSGLFIRYGKNDIDPFCNITGPELLDISLTNYCEKGCDFCYRKSNRQGKFMTIDDYKLIMEQAKSLGVLQVALGGGNPNQHPQFIEILEITRNNNIIPSYTTNGQGMTHDIYVATKEFCGAMALSWYEPYLDAREVINNSLQYNIKTNIHFLLNKITLPKAIKLMNNEDDILKNINAIIYLNYKPIHSIESLCLTDDKMIKDFFEIIKNFKTCKIGFDSCMISFIPLMESDLVLETVDFCEAARFSAYISENLLLYPCSFLNDISNNGINLKKCSLGDGWRYGDEFIKIRHQLNLPGSQDYSINKCQDCKSYSFCHGGCQIFNINRCR